MFHEKAMMMKQENKNSIFKVILIALAVCIVVILGGILLSYCIADKIGTSSDNLNNRGLFGDSWGGVNAIASALAFAGVIVTLYLQNRDLNLQREEMRLQREEFEKENETLKYQRFENLFYNMMNLQQKIVEGLRYEYVEEEAVTVPLDRGRMVKDKRTKRQVVVGRDVFRYLFMDVPLSIAIQNEKQTIYGYRFFLNQKGLACYDDTLVPTYFDHYFRHLYKIVKFVDAQGFEFKESYRYITLLRATLSRFELVWIYYNTLNPDYIGFKDLIEKYSLLKGIRNDLLARTLETEQFYFSNGLTYGELKRKEYLSDFEFYLTDNTGEEGKYDVSAFWNKDDRQSGLEYLQEWRAFVDK